MFLHHWLFNAHPKSFSALAAVAHALQLRSSKACHAMAENSEQATIEQLAFNGVIRTNAKFGGNPTRPLQHLRLEFAKIAVDEWIRQLGICYVRKKEGHDLLSNYDAHCEEALQEAYLPLSMILAQFGARLPSVNKFRALDLQ